MTKTSPTDSLTKIDLLREQLIKLQKEREKIVLEKGLTARDNNDLRENAAFNDYEMQERVITARIRSLSLEITELAKAQKKQ